MQAWSWQARLVDEPLAASFSVRPVLGDACDESSLSERELGRCVTPPPYPMFRKAMAAR
ncbi:hypothetical protein GCM10020220_087260 [Nonomuraea rubra]